MNYVDTHYSQHYAPRTISKETFKSLVEALVRFKPGLPTSERKIKAYAIGPGKQTYLEGAESWKVIDPHSLIELERLQVQLLLSSTEGRSCELHVEFLSNHIWLDVSDRATGWGKSVYEEMWYLLDSLGISSKGFKAEMQAFYFILAINQNVILAISVSLFAFWLTHHNRASLYASIGLFLAGAMPAAMRTVEFFSPPNKIPIIEETVARVKVLHSVK